MPIDNESPENGGRADEEEEYPSGTEVPSDPAGVGENVEDEDQPGLSEDPPQAD